MICDFVFKMGVGYALDLIVLTALGVDMFDCVFPTRTARFGQALLINGLTVGGHKSSIMTYLILVEYKHGDIQFGFTSD